MKPLILIPFLILPLFLSAQETEQKPFIEVTGTAYREIEPNEIYVTIRLKEFEENRQKTSLEKIEKDFYNAVKAAGIDRNRVELADAGSDLGKFRRKDKEAYREKSFQIKLTIIFMLMVTIVANLVGFLCFALIKTDLEPKLQHLAEQVEITLQVAGIDDAEHDVDPRHVPHAPEQHIDGNHFVGRSRGQAIGARKIDNREWLPVERGAAELLRIEISASQGF